MSIRAAAAGRARAPGGWPSGINACNALTVQGILEVYPTESNREHTAVAFGYNIWDDLLLPVGQRKYSLNQIEHKVLRKLGGPRIHFAIVCASTGCPTLRNALFAGRAKASALTIPWCTYTKPEIAHVGLGPNEAEEAGVAMDTDTQLLDEVHRAILDGQTDGFVRIHVRRGTDRIVGATVVADHAGDLISQITLAMTNKIGLKGLGNTIHPYPTQAEAIGKVADRYNRSRLTPRVQWLFQKWLAWTR